MTLNRVTIIGHLGQDLELRYLPTSGQPVTGFSVATDESFTGKDGSRQERVQWHNVVVFGRLAETCTKYLSKGRACTLKGVSGPANSTTRMAAASASARRS